MLAIKRIEACSKLNSWIKRSNSSISLLKKYGKKMADIGGIASDRLKTFIERVETLEEEKTALTEDIREVIAEAKSAGFNGKIIRQIVRLRKLDESDRQEQEAMLDLYKRALEMN